MAHSCNTRAGRGQGRLTSPLSAPARVAGRPSAKGLRPPAGVLDKAEGGLSLAQAPVEAGDGGGDSLDGGDGGVRLRETARGRSRPGAVPAKSAVGGRRAAAPATGAGPAGGARAGAGD